MDLPLSLLRAFEAAARTGSFIEAADNLDRSPSAISHAIRKLERILGCVLFERSGRNVRLSVEGVALMRHIGPAFNDIRRGIDLVALRGPKVLRVHSAPSFAAQWLTPRLPALLASHPNVEIRLAASTDYSQFTTDEFDVDIVYGRPNLEGVTILPLGKELVTPLASPKLRNSIKSLEDLPRHTLIDSDNKKVRWSDWFAANNLSEPPPRGMRFDRSFLAISAATAGLGVALESTRLAEKEIANGQLVPLLEGRVTNISYIGHFLVFPQHTFQRQPLGFFVKWIAEELKLDLDNDVD